ncbi:Protein phosphatase 1H [Labeo rohita]|uniref:Protein phosphatase 1H n=1 Tax=Labeo rohita TaxID=84645 RepID=A0ABQ8MQX8_LABRO|nr:Protein phosphatase 1H [Labeo rohita]
MATIGVTRGLGDHDLKVHDSNICIKPFLSCFPELPCHLVFLAKILCESNASLFAYFSFLGELPDFISAFPFNKLDNNLPRTTLLLSNDAMNGVHHVMHTPGVIFERREITVALRSTQLNFFLQVKVYNLTQYEHGADDVLVMGTDGLWDVLSNEEVAETVTSFLVNCDPDDLHRYTMAAQDLVMRARGVLRDQGWRISNDRLGSGDDISVYIIPLMYGNRQL